MNNTHPTEHEIEELALDIFFAAIEEQACLEGTNSRLAWKVRRQDAQRRALEMLTQFGALDRGSLVLTGSAIGFAVNNASPQKELRLVFIKADEEPRLGECG